MNCHEFVLYISPKQIRKKIGHKENRNKFSHTMRNQGDKVKLWIIWTTINKIAPIDYSTIFEKSALSSQIPKEIYRTAHILKHREKSSDHVLKLRFGLSR